MFAPVARRLAASGRFRPVGIDLRGHGGTDAPAVDDGGVELACPPEVEATLFEASAWDGGAPLAWDHLDTLSASAVVLAGATSWLPREWFEEQARRAAAPFHVVDGGHFFLQEDTARGVELIGRFLDHGA